MMISTKGRYALRVVLDLAENGGDRYVPLSDIARRQAISEKYLESIVALLGKHKLLESMRGKGGGYRLNRAPEAYTVAEIVLAAEGSFAPVACLEADADVCERAMECRTVKLWAELYRRIQDYLGSITVADVLEGKI